MTQSEDFSIEGMHCEACVRRLKMSLEKVPDLTIEKVEVGKVVLAAAKLGEMREQIRAAVEKVGFQLRS